MFIFLVSWTVYYTDVLGGSKNVLLDKPIWMFFTKI